MDTFFNIEAQKRSRVTKLEAQTQHRVVLRFVPPSASKQSEIMCVRDKCVVFHNIGKAVSGSTVTFSVLVANPKKLLYTVANPTHGLLNREKNEKIKSGSTPPPPAPHAARTEKIK